MSEADELRIRRSAMLVHGLPADLRQQVLQRLTPEQNSRLQPLLDELENLGLPAVPLSELDEITRAPDAAIWRACALAPALLVPCFEEGSPVILGRFLQSYDWPWRDALLGALSRSTREAIRSQLQFDLPPLPPSALACLSLYLCRRVVELGVRPARHRHWWARGWSWIR